MAEQRFLTEQASGTFRGPAAQREELRHRIADICGGHKHWEDIPARTFVPLPKLIDQVIQEIDDAKG